MSKFKKSKNGLLAERRLESNTPKNQESNETKLRQNTNKDNAPSDRTSQKIKLITKLINKFSKKEERAIYQQLAKHFQTEQVYRGHLTNGEMAKDRTLQATLKDIIGKIVRKQQDLVDNWMPVSNNNGVQSSKCLIAREWSPKMQKLENNYTYGMFNKRNVDQFKEKENQNKVQNQSNQTEMFNRIFSQLDKLSAAANSNEQNDSFKSVMKGLSASIEERQQLSMKITGLEAQLAKQTERCANLSQANKTVLRQSNKFSTQLHQIIKENAYIKQKYREIEEQFEVLVKEKLQIETELERKERQGVNREKQLQEQYQRKIMCLSMERKEDEESERHDLGMIISSLENRIGELMQQIQEGRLSKQRISLASQVIGYKCYYPKKQLSLSKYQYVCIQFPLKAQYSIQTIPEGDRLQMNRALQINIEPLQNRNEQIQDVIQAGLQIFSLVDEMGIQTDTCILIDQSTFTDLADHSCVQSQTSNVGHHIESQTQLHQQSTEIIIDSSSIDESSQTQNQHFVIEHSLNQKYDFVISKVNKEMNTNPRELVFHPQLLYYQSQVVERIFVQQIIQTELQSEDQNIQQEKRSEDLSEEEQNQSSSTIISMLLEAQQCLIVPEIVFLKEQILRYRQQIEKLKRQVRIECKQKEDQNAFQFSL